MDTVSAIGYGLFALGVAGVGLLLKNLFDRIAYLESLLRPPRPHKPPSWERPKPSAPPADDR